MIKVGEFKKNIKRLFDEPIQEAFKGIDDSVEMTEQEAFQKIKRATWRFFIHIEKRVKDE